jgi:hypothetical protein
MTTTPQWHVNLPVLTAWLIAAMWIPSTLRLIWKYGWDPACLVFLIGGAIFILLSIPAGYASK